MSQKKIKKNDMLSTGIEKKRGIYPQMDKNIPDISLLRAYINGQVSFEEERMVEEWLEQAPGHINKLEALTGIDQISVPDFDHKKVKNQILARINADVGHIPNPRVVAPLVRADIARKKRKHAGVWLKAAAAITIIVTAGLFAWLTQQPETIPQITFTEITSPVRTVTSYTLPDGSTVELNANSTLTYPSSFSAEERIVYLDGEAFFEVTSDPQRPFRVYSGELETTVLGTKFNVNYMQTLGKVEVALVEGSVEVGFLDNRETEGGVLLQPDEWISYAGGNEKLKVQQGVTSKILWRNGILEFKENTLEEVAVILGNWYGVDVSIEDASIKNRKIVGSFEDESLEHVLETLKFIAGIEYKMNKKEHKNMTEVMLTEQKE